MKGIKNQANLNYATFFIYVNSTCSRSIIGASKLSKYLVQNGLHSVNKSSKADLIIIFTCGSFAFSEKNSILTIEKAIKYDPNRVIITGCIMKINPKKIKPYNVLAKILPENLGLITEIVQAKVPYDEKKYSYNSLDGIYDLIRVVPSNKIKENFLLLKYAALNPESLKNIIKDTGRNFFHKKINTFFNKIPYLIEISKGCLSNCTYCAIKLAQPVFRSISEEKIINNFKLGLSKRNKSFKLISADIGCYGLDIHTNLPSLLKKLFKIKENYNIILDELNARWFISYYPELLNVLMNNYDKVSELTIPIQSGSDRILKLMNRNYKIDYVKKCLLDLRKKIPDLKVGTHILVGFPSETDEDFQKSVDLIRSINFSVVTIFCYDDRPCVLAFTFPNKVSKETITMRAKILAKEVNVAGGRAILPNP